MNDVSDFPEIDGLSRALRRPLPGRAAQDLMLPSLRRGMVEAPPAGESWRPASVLVLIHPLANGKLAFPLVERSSTIGRHRGEIGLPGGSHEGGESALEAALRETAEETGLDEKNLAATRVLGALTPLRVPPSGFEIYPFVAWLPATPAFRPEYPEIEGILEFSLEELRSPASRSTAMRLMGDRAGEIPYFAVSGREVWGATAMILSELAVILRTRRAGRRRP